MRFLHLGDLHIGKILHGVNLIEDQAYLLKQIIKLIREEKLEYVIIAGDLYDRSIPSVEAIELVNAFFDVLINKLNVLVYVVSGNHDSAERLNFASTILKDQGLIIETTIQKELSSYEVKDEYGEFYIHLLPFFKPSKIKSLFQEDEIKTYQEAFNYYMKQNGAIFNDGKRHLLVTHQFFQGENTPLIMSSSESPLSVGGSEIIDVSMIKLFDYVALGHLHAPQHVLYPHIRYSGSLLKYSVDEASQKKSYPIITMKEKGNIEIDKREIKPLRDVVVINDYFDDIIKNVKENNTDYTAFVLKDKTMIVNAMDRLKIYYPNTLMITYEFYKDRIESDQEVTFIYNKSMSDEDLFYSFYQQVSGTAMDEEKKDLFLTLYHEFKDGEENK